MPLRWRKRPQWPPVPSVEDEIASLSRELDGLSYLGELPGFEGVHYRGSVDQSPVILDVLIITSISPLVGEESTSGTTPSDVSAGPPTPPVDIKQDPFSHFWGEPQSQEPLKKAPLRTPSKAQDVPPQGKPPKPVHKQASGSRRNTAGPQQKPVPRAPEPAGRPADVPVQKPAPKSVPKPQPKVAQGFQNAPAPVRPSPPAGVVRKPSSSAMPKRSESVKHRRPTKHLAIDPHSSPNSGYMSDSAAIHRKHRNPSSNPPTPCENKPPLSPGLLSPGLSVAERLEEKLRRRREQQREHGASPENVEQKKEGSTPEKPVFTGPVEGMTAEIPGAFPELVDLQASIPPPAPAPPPPPPPAPAPPSASVPAPPQTTLFPSVDPSGPASDGEAPLSTSSDPSKKLNPPQPPTAGKKSALRSVSLDRAQPAPPHPSRRRTVSFAEKPLEPPPSSLQIVKQEPPGPVQQLLPPSQEPSPAASRSTSPSASFGLFPCPRSIPVAGYQDWHTIQGLNHLEICPSCMKQMRKSKYRDRFILSNPRPRTEKIRCSMSEPWARLAWTQTLKKGLDHLNLLLQITRPPPGSKACTGRIISDQYWYRVVDPETDTFLPQFNVCSSCVRNVRILMPAHHQTFEPSRNMHERVCDFVTDSPRFIRYIDALDHAANRAEDAEKATPLDLSDFLAYARRKVVLRDCRRSRLTLNTWHYMAQLPEFTVCEDCYDDVVWPLAKSRYPIARQFSTVMRVLPGDGPSSCREASCKLYSPRIRAKFNEAVRRSDMPYLQWVAMKRYDAEQRFRARQEELLEDERRGYDCSVELRKNLEEWKRWE